MSEHIEVTAKNLRSIRGAREMTQKQVADILGVPLNAVSKIELGNRELTSAEKKLLDLFFFGRLPEGVIRSSDDLGHALDFTEQEWKIVEVLALRAGQTAAEWIRTKILDYLAFSPEAKAVGANLASLPLAAEEPPEYQARKRKAG